MQIPTFAAFIENSRKLRPVYVDIAINNRIVHNRIKEDEKEKTEVQCDPNGPFRELILAAMQAGPACISDLFLNGQVFGFGPKVFAPKTEECFALEQIRPKLILPDYHQPFKTFVIEFPEDYQNKRAINGVKPLCVVLHHKEGFFLLSGVVWSSGEATIRLLITRNDRTIEQIITDAHGRLWDGSLPTTDSEETITENCVRLGVNACLLLSMYGCKKVGYANPSHAERLIKRIKKGNINAKEELDNMPEIYTFEQNIKLYRSSNERISKEGNVTGKQLPFHWRAGHIRNQAHGPAFTLRKKIFVQPTMVRADLMTDQEGSVRYS